MKINQIIKNLSKIYYEMLEKEAIQEHIFKQVHSAYQLSARNLFRYLILRSYDLRKYHDSLSDLGVSSLRTAEGYVLSNLQNVLMLLHLLQGEKWNQLKSLKIIGYKQSTKLLRKHSNDLFKEKNKKHATEIMVTLPNETAENIALISDLIDAGMQIARINLSHGNLDIWTQMIKNIHELSSKKGIEVKIYMDMSGPKIRTSKINILEETGHHSDAIKLTIGEHLILTKSKTAGKKSLYDTNNELIQMAEVGVLLPEIIDDMKVGDLVYFDDGMIKAKAIEKRKDEVEIEIIATYKSKLSSSKGINLPGTKLNLPSLTARDKELLPFICEHADMVGYSFVRNANDVKSLYSELDKHHQKEIGVIFKIENQEAFDNLPLILFEGMKRDKIGVMIARGDLAVEVGFERISEVQNQILWICEAAHVPVIWATQVLENLAKTGVATRAEVTDAAQSAQAECVMLNKGPYIVEAVRTLKNILSKMEKHSVKKKSSLRALNVAKLSLKNMNIPSKAPIY
jgi:pyruvate kinase